MTGGLFQDSISFEDEFLISDSGEGELPSWLWPFVRGVIAVNKPGTKPRFRVFGPLLFPAAFSWVFKRLPGVFVRGGPEEVKKLANKVGGQLVGPEKHGNGLWHYHLINKRGNRIHIWYKKEEPPGEFFE